MLTPRAEKHREGTRTCLNARCERHHRVGFHAANLSRDTLIPMNQRSMIIASDARRFDQFDRATRLDCSPWVRLSRYETSLTRGNSEFVEASCCYRYAIAVSQVSRMTVQAEPQGLRRHGASSFESRSLGQVCRSKRSTLLRSVRYFSRLRGNVGFGSVGVGRVHHVTRSARAAKLWGLVKPWALRRRTWRRLLVPSMRPLEGRPAACQARIWGM